MYYLSSYRKEFSPTKTNVSTARSKSQNKKTNQKSKSPINVLNNNLMKDGYFYHYRNAMYMGGINVFQRNGKGIMMYDDGTIGITSFYNDMYHGDNIFLLNSGSLASIEFQRDKINSSLYKSKDKLFYAKYKNDCIDGGAILINFSKKELIYATFKKGEIVDKIIQRNHEILSSIFQIKNLESCFPKNHIKNLNMEFQKLKDVEILKRGSKMTIGFFKNGVLNGLGFTVFQSSFDNLQGNQNNLQIVERGLYKNSQLNGFGERRYKNGNIYIGEFKNDIFEGIGILKNSTKKNWISGKFQKGILTELIKHSAQVHMDEQDKIIQKILESIHQRKTTWLNKEIYLISEGFFEKDIEKIQKCQFEKKINLENRRSEMLKRIQQNFITDQDRPYTPISEFHSNLKLPHFMENIQNRTDFHKIQDEQENENNYNEFKQSQRSDQIEAPIQQVRRIKQNSINFNKEESLGEKKYVPLQLFSSRKYKLFDSPLSFTRQKMIYEKVPLERRSPSPPFLNTSLNRDYKNFTPLRQVIEYDQLYKKSPRLSTKDLDNSAESRIKRTEGILDSMHRRQLKKSQL